MGWEYKIIRPKDLPGFFGASGLENDLNDKGKDGWEAVAMFADPEDPKSYGVLMKRPLAAG